MFNSLTIIIFDIGATINSYQHILSFDISNFILRCQMDVKMLFLLYLIYWFVAYNPWYYRFLPQQFLYFFPLPHALSPLVYIVYIVFIVLFVFQGFHRQVTIYIYIIYSIYCIICIYLLRTFCEHCSQYFILLMNGYWTINIRF